MAVNALAVDAEHELVDLVRCALRDRLIGGGSKTSTPPSYPVLLEPAGCFVTLHRHGKLRGCIGRLDATQPLWISAIEMAGAVIEDPRFVDEPVTLQELPELEFDVSILSRLEPAPSYEAVDLWTEGIYLTCGGRTGCFLPQVAQETGWSREQLLSRLCTEKMGLAPDAWRDPAAKLAKFSVTVIGPVPAT